MALTTERGLAVMVHDAVLADVHEEAFGTSSQLRVWGTTPLAGADESASGNCLTNLVLDRLFVGDVELRPILDDLFICDEATLGEALDPSDVLGVFSRRSIG